MNSRDQRTYLHARAFQVRRLFDPNAARPSHEEPLGDSPRPTIDLAPIFSSGSVPRSISSTQSLRNHHAFTDREEYSLAEEVLEKAKQEVAASQLKLRLPETAKRFTEPARSLTQRYVRTARTQRIGRGPKVQPFGLDSQVHIQKSHTSPQLSKRDIAQFAKTKFLGKYRDFFRKYFHTQLESLVQRTSSEQQDAAMRLSLNELRKYTHQEENRMKPKMVREAVKAFRQEKLVFVYGSEFRGRYISKTHGDILKS